MGEPPVTLIGEGTSGVRDQAGFSCGEPDDATLARRNAPTNCALYCEMSGDEECSPFVQTEGPWRAIDMRNHDGVGLNIRVCPSNDTQFELRDMGPHQTSEHDARIVLAGNILSLFPRSASDVATSTVGGLVTECTDLNIVVADQLVYVVPVERGLCGTALFRVAPPVDRHGVPDTLWWFRAYAPVSEVGFCFY